MINNIKKYCDIVRESSNENEIAIQWLYENKLYKKVIGTLREELELYIRTFYLLNQNQIERERILNSFFEGFKWKVTEREMVNFAQNNSFKGWEYHNANLTIDSKFEDIIKFSLDIFYKIKDNMEYQLEQLENNIV